MVFRATIRYRQRTGLFLNAGCHHYPISLQKNENLYPRLNDIDDDWADSKEGEKKKEEKKVRMIFDL